MRKQPPFLRNPESIDDDDGEVVGEVVNVKLGGEDSEIGDAQRRRIAYGSVSPFALLQSRRNSILSLNKMDTSSSSMYQSAWWEYVMEYSTDIKYLLCNSISSPTLLIEDPRSVIKVAEEPTSLKAAWELMELFYAVPERIVDWLSDYDILLSSSHPTVYSKLEDFQKELVGLQDYVPI